MKEQILSDRSHDHPIQIDNFVTYLHQHGWQKIDHPNTRLLVFQGVNDDRGYPIQIVLPSQSSFEDSDSRNERLRQRLLAKAVNLLAAIEDRFSPARGYANDPRDDRLTQWRNPAFTGRWLKSLKDK